LGFQRRAELGTISASELVGENRAGDAAGGVSNPFTPKMFGGKKPNSQ
jgi:hypothetical protein